MTLGVALCGTVVLGSWVVAGLAGLDSPGIDNAATASVEGQRDADVQSKTASQVTIIAKTRVAEIDVAMATTSAGAAAAGITAGSSAADSIDENVSPASSPALAAEKLSVQLASLNPADPVQDDTTKETKEEAITTVEIFDECLVAEICIDRYLFALYQRTPKRDSIKVPERRKVTVKKNGKTRTITKTVTKLVDEDFTWKDPKAAEKASMPLQDYVIGGMERSFKLKLFRTLRALDEAGLKPGITSAFRDDYRQSIASGLKAASDRSFHGGSSRGGYGHGLAADVVSVKGRTRAERWVSTESLWKWIDAHGKEFGIGRPYLDRDPPHVGPTDGKEYLAHQHGSKVKHAKAAVKKRNRVAVRHDHNAVNRPRIASSKVGGI